MALNFKNPPPPAGVDYTKHLDTAQPVVSKTTITKKKASELVEDLLQDKTEVVNPAVFSTMQISVGGGRTLNLGNYESARIDVCVVVPCTKESLEESYEWASTWVSEKLIQAEKEAKGE